MTNVVARSDCKVSIYVYHICACLIWVRLGAPSTRITNTTNIILHLLHICLCKQVWVLPFVHVNKVIETQIEVREHLEKVHRRYITERLQHTSEQRGSSHYRNINSKYKCICAICSFYIYQIWMISFVLIKTCEQFYLWMHTRIHLHLHIHILIHTYTHTHIRIHTHTHTHTHTSWLV